DHILHGIEAHAAARYVGDRALHRKAGQEQELQQLGFTHRAGGFTGREVPRDYGLAHVLQIDTASIVRDDDVQRAGAVTRFDPYEALGGFARRSARGRRLDTVIQSVAQQMPQWRVELRQNVAVHLRGAADDFQFDFPPER